MTNVHWRYVFVLLSALSGLSIATTTLLRSGLKKGRYSLTHPRPGQTHLQSFFGGCACIDFIGAGTFVGGVTLILLATSWGGLFLGVTSGPDTTYCRPSFAGVVRCISTIHGPRSLSSQAPPANHARGAVPALPRKGRDLGLHHLRSYGCSSIRLFLLCWRIFHHG